MKKLSKFLMFLSEHENKIVFALWVVILMGGCGIMALTVVNDHIVQIIK